MNTRIQYMLRDASNYKAFHEIVIAGEITEAEGDMLRQVAQFIPEQVGLPDLTEELGGHYDDDTPWHELNYVELTDGKPDYYLGATEQRLAHLQLQNQPLLVEDQKLDIHEFVELFRTTIWDDGSVNVKAIGRAAFEDGDVRDGLNELVHDVMSKQASEINNGGVLRQVEYLTEQGLSRKEIHEALGLPLDERDTNG